MTPTSFRVDFKSGETGGISCRVDRVEKTFVFIQISCHDSKDVGPWSCVFHDGDGVAGFCELRPVVIDVQHLDVQLWKGNNIFFIIILLFFNSNYQDLNFSWVPIFPWYASLMDHGSCYNNYISKGIPQKILGQYDLKH